MNEQCCNIIIVIEGGGTKDRFEGMGISNLRLSGFAVGQSNCFWGLSNVFCLRIDTVACKRVLLA